ncbi:hypothetical protein QBC41DRAFT_241593, partial [Cercophora samala]
MNNFGVIEVASTATKTTPGWAYVPDTGPALPAALQPKNRKRAARNAQPGLSLSDLTARQENKLRKDLEALSKDGTRDVQIPIPNKPPAGRSHKHTPAIRKILQSQKTFSNHLDDHQALLALAESNPAAVVNNPLLFLNKPLTPLPQPQTTTKSASPAPVKEKGGGSSTNSKRGAAAAKRAAAKEREEEQLQQQLQQQQRKRAKAEAEKLAAVVVEDGQQEDDDVEMTDPPAQPQPQPQPQEEEEEKAILCSYPPDGTILPAYGKPPPASHPGDDDPLLVSAVPSFPTDEELRALMTAPPLGYMDARATFGGEEGENKKYPTRVFCEMCGYWGRVKCIKCGVRVCGLDCLEGHREECVTRYGL